MKLSIDFGALRIAVAPMGDYQSNFGLGNHLDPLQEIETFVKKVRPSEIEIELGFVVHEGSPVRLYIEDHSHRFEDAVAQRSFRNKVHVVDCTTLKNMRSVGRFERYVVTNKLDECLTISGVTNDGRSESDDVKLDVCKNCLKQLNYRGANLECGKGRQKIVDDFSMLEFLETYSTVFKALPKRRAGDGTSSGYTEDWPAISRELRLNKGYTCEHCKVDMAEHRDLCHVHHINGVKSDNAKRNLAVLCLDCHRKQPHHDGMWVSAKHMSTIRQLRRDADTATASSWKEAYSLVDSAGRDTLALFESKGFPLPVIGLEIMLHDQVAGELEIAWLETRVGVWKSTEDAEAAKRAGWVTCSLFEVADSWRELKEQF